jgi:hypothetical protein
MDFIMNTASERAPRIISTSGLQWLVLPGEAQATYTNFCDGRKGNASELVATVNADPAQNLGHSDWRLPTLDELQTLIGTDHAPTGGWFWSSSPYVGMSGHNWSVNFYFGYADCSSRNYNLYVRLVRSS